MYKAKLTSLSMQKYLSLSYTTKNLVNMQEKHKIIQ